MGGCLCPLLMLDAKEWDFTMGAAKVDILRRGHAQPAAAAATGPGRGLPLCLSFAESAEPGTGGRAFPKISTADEVLKV